MNYGYRESFRSTLDNMTCNDHNIVMTTASVSEFKARLSEYLRGVQRGRSVTITDRRNPVARVIPASEPSSALLDLRLPVDGSGAPGRVRIPPPLRLKADVLTILLADRAARR